MPKIVRNEIEYSSTTSTANQISYLNTTSGLSATNVQDAIDGLDSNFDYFINEKAVGVWIDNKTIYRCVFTGFNISTTANTWTATTVSSSNISTLIHGRVLDSSGQSFECSLGFNNQKVVISMPLARSNLITLILEYTKI